MATAGGQGEGGGGEGPSREAETFTFLSSLPSPAPLGFCQGDWGALERNRAGTGHLGRPEIWWEWLRLMPQLRTHWGAEARATALGLKQRHPPFLRLLWRAYLVLRTVPKVSAPARGQEELGWPVLPSSSERSGKWGWGAGPAATTCRAHCKMTRGALFQMIKNSRWWQQSVQSSPGPFWAQGPAQPCKPKAQEAVPVRRLPGAWVPACRVPVCACVWETERALGSKSFLPEFLFAQLLTRKLH